MITLTCALGPTISWFFADINWHYVFMINIPVDGIVVLLGYFLLPEGKALEKHKISYWNCMTLLLITISTLSILVYSFKGSWLTETIYDEIFFPLMIISLTLFWWVEKNPQNLSSPLVLLKQRDILIGSVVTLLGFCSWKELTITLFLPDMPSISATQRQLTWYCPHHCRRGGHHNHG